MKKSLFVLLFIILLITGLFTACSVNTFTVSFNTNGGNIIEDMTIVKGSVITMPDNPEKEGYIFDGWMTDETLNTVFDKESEIKENFTLYAKWKLKDYSITFEENGGSLADNITYNIETESQLPVSTLAGYTFGGWYADADFSGESIASISKGMTGDKTLYAKWIANQYKITFNTDGGSEVAEIKQDCGTAVLKPADPLKTGYTFINWYSDTGLTSVFVFDKMPASDTILYAKWQINKYTLTFNTDGGSEVAEIKQDYGTAVTKPADPEKEGHFFVDWYSDNGLTTVYNFDKMPASNITLYAKWTVNLYTITLNSNEGTFVPFVRFYYGEDIVIIGNPEREGYNFSGWYNDAELNTPFNLTKMPAKNFTLYAKWSINQYSIIFNSNGGSAVQPLNQDYGTAVVKPADPVKEGYSFVNWYSDIGLTSVYTFDKMPAESVTLYAKWDINQYTISFDTNGGSAIEQITQDYGTAVVKPSDPVKVGYFFLNWCSDKGLTNSYFFNTMPGSNITLYAKWDANTYILTFDGNYENSVNSTKNVAYDSAIGELPVVTREGNDFVRWYYLDEQNQKITVTEQTVYNFISDKTVYAEWINLIKKIYLTKGDYLESYYPGFYYSEDPETIILAAEYFGANAGTHIKAIINNDDSSDLTGFYFDNAANARNFYNYIKLLNPDMNFKISESIVLAGYAEMVKYILDDFYYEDNIYYVKNGTGYTLILSMNLDKNIILNSTVNGLPLTKIGVSSFYDKYTESVTIPSSVTEIEKNAFNYCYSLKYIYFEGTSSLSVIGDNAFYNSGLKLINIPASVTEIGINAFGSCGNLKTVTFDENINLDVISDDLFSSCYSLSSITIPDSVNAINSEAFSYCTNLASLNLGSGVESIDSSAFMSCQSLSSLTIPASVKSIEMNAFANCINLISVNFADSGAFTMLNDAFKNTPWYSNLAVNNGFKIENDILYSYSGTENDIVIPEGVLFIADNAMKGTQITSVTIPSTVKNIGQLAFNGCSRLAAVTFSEPSSLTELKYYSFGNCTSLPYITIPSSVQYVSSLAFANCSSLIAVNTNANNLNFVSLNGVLYNYDLTELVYFPEAKNLDGESNSFLLSPSVTTIGEYAFYNSNPSLKHIYTSADLKYINDNAFFNSKIISFNLPNDSVLERIGAYAFFDTGIGTLNLPDTVKYIGERAFLSCASIDVNLSPSSQLEYLGESAFDSSGITDFYIPAGISVINSSTFHCSSLSTIILSEGLTEIGSNAFVGCPLSNIVLPQTLQKIGYGAFNGCDQLVYLNIPSNIEIIDRNTFSGCTNLGTDPAQPFTIPSSVKIIMDEAFTETGFTSIVIPSSVEYMGSFVFAGSLIASVTLPENLKTLKAGTFTNCANLNNVVIPDFVNIIEYNAFMQCTSLTNITLSANLLIIGDYCFEGCSSLNSILIPQSVKMLGISSFKDCTSLSSIDISALDELEYLPENLFYNCTALTQFEMPNNLKKIGINVFYNCINLETVITTENLEEIGQGCFENCVKLTSINLGICNLKNIDNKAFYGCQMLSEVTMKQGLEYIGASAFMYCTLFTSIVIPEGVTVIGNSAFNSCSNLLNITFPQSLKNINYESVLDTPWYNSQADGLIYAGNILIKYKGTMPALTNLTLNNGTTGIGNSAFSNVSGLVSITIPDTVTFIGINAFINCVNLENVTFLLNQEGKSDLTSIGNNAFSNCSKLISINLPEGLTTIPNYCFSGCNALLNLVIPSTVSYFGYYYPFKCNNLQVLEIKRHFNSVDWFNLGDTTFGNPNTVVKVPSDCYLDYIIKYSVFSNRIITDKNIVKFYTFGYGTVTPQLVDNNQVCTAPADALPYNSHILEGWYTEIDLINKFDFNTPITSNITLYAKFIVCADMFIMTFDSMGGSAVPSVSKVCGGSIDVVSETELDGYIFDGWYKDTNYTQNIKFPYAIDKNITVYAKWVISNGSDYSTAHQLTLNQTLTTEIQRGNLFLYFIAEDSGDYNLSVQNSLYFNVNLYTMRENYIEISDLDAGCNFSADIHLTAGRLYYVNINSNSIEVYDFNITITKKI